MSTNKLVTYIHNIIYVLFAVSTLYKVEQIVGCILYIAFYRTLYNKLYCGVHIAQTLR